MEGVDYKVDRLIHMWNETNLQDRDLAENNQRGGKRDRLSTWTLLG